MFLLKHPLNWNSFGLHLAIPNVADSVSLFVEAEPDHRWDINMTSGTEYDVAPDDSIAIAFTAKNTGNAEDTLRIVPSFTYAYSGLDSSVWSAPTFTGQEVAVNQSEVYSLEFTVPSDTWSATVADMQFGVYSGRHLGSKRSTLRLYRRSCIGLAVQSGEHLTDHRPGRAKRVANRRPTW